MQTSATNSDAGNKEKFNSTLMLISSGGRIKKDFLDENFSNLNFLSAYLNEQQRIKKN